MISLTPIISANPINPNVGWNNSWIKVENDQNRPLFAQATYVTNLENVGSLLTTLINEIRQKPDDNGFVFVDDNEVHTGNFETLKVVANTRIVGLTADNTIVGNLGNYELPVDFEVNGQIYAFQLSGGAVIAYNAVDLNRFPNSIITISNSVLVSMESGESIVTIEPNNNL